ADVRRMGEWSPECVRCEWLGGAAGATVGARFRGHNRNGLRRWSTVSTVVAADPRRIFAFRVSSLGLPVPEWRSAVTPTPGGCRARHGLGDHPPGRLQRRALRGPARPRGGPARRRRARLADRHAPGARRRARPLGLGSGRARGPGPPLRPGAGADPPGRRGQALLALLAARPEGGPRRLGTVLRLRPRPARVAGA